MRGTPLLSSAAALLLLLLPLASALVLRTHGDPNANSLSAGLASRQEAIGEAERLKKAFNDRALELEKNSKQISKVLPKVTASTLAAIKEKDKAEEILEQARKYIETVKTQAYDAAKKSAEAEVAKLDLAAQAHYDQLMAELAAKANAPKNAKAEAAAKAAKPYFDAELKTLALVTNYNLKANELIAIAKQEVAFSHNIADHANALQHNGDGAMAARLMIQAHGAIADAQMKEDQAKKVYALARSLNSSIPSYQNAAQQAAVHVLATHPGFLQEGVRFEERPKLLSPEALIERGLGELKSMREEVSAKLASILKR